MRYVRILLLVAALALTGTTSVFAEDANAPETWAVNVGMKMTSDTQIFNMQPGVVYIHEGDTVKFTNNDMLAPHLLGFLLGNPPPAEDLDITQYGLPQDGVWAGDKMLFSPEMLPGDVYSITFAKAGAYDYYCLIHPVMKGTVVVLPKGSLIPNKVEQIAASKTVLEDQKKIAEEMKNLCSTVNYDKNKDGTLTYKVFASVGNDQLMINAFLPGEVYINAGDAIEWTNGAEGEGHLAVVNMPKGMQVFTEGGLNPDATTPHKPTYDGTGYASSGILFGGGDPRFKPNFKLTFTKPGTYSVTDALWGYTGKIVVAPKGAAKIMVDGKAIVTTTEVKSGHVFAPLTAVTKALGVTAVSGKTITINGKKLVTGSESAPYADKGVTYVAVDSVAQLLGKTYTWDPTAKLLSVRMK